jgi:hypothetical protein
MTVTITSYEKTSNGDVEVKVETHIRKGGPIPEPGPGKLTDAELAKLLEEYENVLKDAREHIADLTSNPPKLPVRGEWEGKLDDFPDLICLPGPGDWDGCLPDSIC